MQWFYRLLAVVSLFLVWIIGLLSVHAHAGNIIILELLVQLAPRPTLPSLITSFLAAPTRRTRRRTSGEPLLRFSVSPPSLPHAEPPSWLYARYQPNSFALQSMRFYHPAFASSGFRLKKVSGR